MPDLDARRTSTSFPMSGRRTRDCSAQGVGRAARLGTKSAVPFVKARPRRSRGDLHGRSQARGGGDNERVDDFWD